MFLRTAIQQCEMEGTLKTMDSVAGSIHPVPAFQQSTTKLGKDMLEGVLRGSDGDDNDEEQCIITSKQEKAATITKPSSKLYL
jgi:hypothetical protein